MNGHSFMTWIEVYSKLYYAKDWEASFFVRKEIKLKKGIWLHFDYITLIYFIPWQKSNSQYGPDR